jgi:hypothetical protein
MGFRSEAEVDRWLALKGLTRGYVATAQQMFDFSREWYGDRMEESWEPPTAESAMAMFARHGLRGEFWDLG